ncbi:MAG: periplasmic heavy metal sensor [Candidatus Cloacimonetes bacterium]|nr:periplasmic heavy metal sensor [Candidatus Cloacimonadota bacterium]
MRKTIILILVLAVTGTLLVAQTGMKKRGMEREHDDCNERFEGRGELGRDRGFNGQMMFLPDELNLNAEQTEKVDAIRIKHRKEMIDTEAEIKNLRLDKHVALNNENFAEAKKKVDEISKLEAQMEKAMITSQESILNILTTEQKEQLREMRLNRVKGRKNR